MTYQLSLITDAELNFLKTSIGENKTIVEIGCYMGATTCALAEFNKIIAIDPFIDYEPTQIPSQNINDVKKTFEAAIKGKDIIWHKEKSEDVLKWWKDEIDGVFIDGNHLEPFVLKDIGWIPFVRKGGIIAFHDYTTWLGVRNVVDKYIKGKYEEIGIIDDLIIFRK